MSEDFVLAFTLLFFAQKVVKLCGGSFLDILKTLLQIFDNEQKLIEWPSSPLFINHEQECNL